jgi:hypothetical protein
MDIKFLTDFRGKETKEIFYVAGSVITMRDDHANRLIGWGFAEKFTGGDGGVLPPPPVDPALTVKSMMTPKVAALVAHDNDLIIQSLREEMLAEEALAETKLEIVFENDPIALPVEPEPEPAPRRAKKAKK